MSRARGATLVELLIYSLLLLLLMGGIYYAFHISRLYYDAAQGTTTAQQEALKAASLLSRELAGSSQGHVFVTDGGAFRALTMLSARTDARLFSHDAEGDLLWQRWVILYHDTASGEVRLKEQALPAPTEDPDAAAPPDTAAVVADADVPFRVVARGISAFSATVAGVAVTYSVTSQTVSRRFGQNQVTLQSQLSLRQ